MKQLLKDLFISAIIGLAATILLLLWLTSLDADDEKTLNNMHTYIAIITMMLSTAFTLFLILVNKQLVDTQNRQMEIQKQTTLLNSLQAQYFINVDTYNMAQDQKTSKNVRKKLLDERTSIIVAIEEIKSALKSDS
ncbi:MAG: hypothetical protein OXF30_01860 [Candidatus Saccharibacteria bacterium]|nr:hypothetical protein [Candidatus Saccharibacteria bacterium]